MVTKRELDRILEIQELQESSRYDKDKHDMCIRELKNELSKGVITSPSKRRALAYLYQEYKNKRKGGK